MTNKTTDVDEDSEAEKIFKVCADAALIMYPHADPVGVYQQVERFGSAEAQSPRMIARLFRVWLRKHQEYPWYLNCRAAQDYIDRYDPRPPERDEP